MFVRILDEGRYEITGSRVCTVEELAAELETIADTGSVDAFGPVLATLIGVIRRGGQPVADDGPVDLVLPDEVADVRRVLDALDAA